MIAILDGNQAIPPVDELHIINHLLQQNCTNPLLDEGRAKAQEGDSPWSLKDGLLLHEGQLVVPDDTNLWTQLLDDVHQQALTAYPGRHKTRELVRTQYWWPTWRKDTL